MKKLLFFIAAALILVGCERDYSNTNAYFIKGHTFRTEYSDISFAELSFKRNMSVEYKYQNSWEKEPNSRKDLYYTIDSEKNFTIYREVEDSIYGKVFGVGTYYPDTKKPFIKFDNLGRDFLFLQH